MQEQEVIRQIASEAANRGWDAQPARLSADPDVVIKTPDGVTYAVEVKLGEGRTHFSSIAQVDAIAHHLSAASDGSSVEPVLVTNLEVSSSVALTAESVGVHIVDASGSSSEVATSVVVGLQGIADLDAD